MPKRTCTIPGCDKDNFAKGWCAMHYFRVRKTGDPGGAAPLNAWGVAQCLDAQCSEPCMAYGRCREHVLAYVGWTVDSDGCHLWSGSRNHDGYGLLGEISRTRAHRLAWEVANGRPIPDGLIVRHACDKPPCINPDHLSIGTHADNVQDALERGRRPRAKTSAARGVVLR